MYWRASHRVQLWAALKNDDADALKEALGPAVKNPKLFRELDRGLWKGGEGQKGSEPVSITYTCAALKGGLPDDGNGAPKCLTFLLQTFGKTAYRNYCEKSDAQAMALLLHRWDVVKAMQANDSWSVPHFVQVRRCAAASFDPENPTKVGLALAMELGSAEDLTHETVLKDATPESLLPPPEQHSMFCRGGGVVIDFYDKDVRRFTLRLNNNCMYKLKKKWNGSMRIRSVFKSPTLSMYFLPA